MAEESTVKVKCFNGSSFSLGYTGEETVAEFQAKIAKESGIEIDRQTLLFKGQLLEGDKKLTTYNLTNESTISVAVRRSGKWSGKPKGSTASSPTAASATGKKDDKEKNFGKQETKAGDVKEEEKKKYETGGGTGFGAGLGTTAGTTAGTGGMGSMDSSTVEDMVRNLGMGGGAPGQNAPWMAGLDQMMGGVGGGAAAFQQFMKAMPQLMSGLWDSPEMKEYLGDPAKQEASRAAIAKNIEENPFINELVKADPEFKKMIEDPQKWREGMQAAKQLYDVQGPSLFGTPATQTTSRGTSTTGNEASGKAKTAEEKDKSEKDKTDLKQTAADVAPLGIDIQLLSEAYGHALGQSLVNSGLGLDPDLVIKGLKSCCNGKEFPMSLPTYEKQMSQLQEIASKFVAESNLEDANKFFAETKKEPSFKVIAEGKVMYQSGEMKPDLNKPAATKDSTVLVVLQGRLLDDRFFFTCPAADDSGDGVHPLTLPLDTAPPALRDGIVGMRETEERTLFVHPSGAEKMTEMFGDLLPVNALLIFDLELVKAQAPPEEVEAARNAANAGLSLSSVASAKS